MDSKITELLEKMGASADRVWPQMVLTTQVEAAYDLALMTVVLVAGGVVLALWIRRVRGQTWLEPFLANDEGLVLTLAATTWFGFAALFLIFLPDMVMTVLYPEAATALDILKQR